MSLPLNNLKLRNINLLRRKVLCQVRLTLKSLLIGICMHDYVRFVCYDVGKAQMKEKSDYLKERNIRISMTSYVLLVDL